MSPYYADDHVTLYHARWEDVPLDLLRADVLVTDPPYGVQKRERTYHRLGVSVGWDDAFPIESLGPLADRMMAAVVLPGVGNLHRCPDTLGSLDYRWTFAAHVVNGMTRSPVGFGNWIPAVLYARPDVKVYRQRSDVGRFTVSGPKVAHPTPKPLSVMDWLVGMAPDGAVLDPYAGSGTTLLAAARAGRRSVGVEVDARYCEVAANRLRQAVLGLSA